MDNHPQSSQILRRKVPRSGQTYCLRGLRALLCERHWGATDQVSRPDRRLWPCRPRMDLYYTGVTMPCRGASNSHKKKKKATAAAAAASVPAGFILQEGNVVHHAMASTAESDVSAAALTLLAIGGDAFNTGSFTVSRPFDYTMHRECHIWPVSSVNHITWEWLVLNFAHFRFVGV